MLSAALYIHFFNWSPSCKLHSLCLNWRQYGVQIISMFAANWVCRNSGYLKGVDYRIHRAAPSNFLHKCKADKNEQIVIVDLVEARQWMLLTSLWSQIL